METLQTIDTQELVTALTNATGTLTAVHEGRRFHRIVQGDRTRFFVMVENGAIFGAKSNFQYNPRRMYGDLTTVGEWDWSTLTPKPGTLAEANHASREATFTSQYKKRGRPRKS